MKYRLLTMEELGFLEEELKQFLIVNSVHGDEWERLCDQEKEKAEKLIEMFSDTVLQTVYERIKFLEFRANDILVLIKIMDDHAESITIKRSNHSDIDLSNDVFLEKLFELYKADIEVYRAVKQHQLSREEEIHQLIMRGCGPSTPERWQAFDNMIPSRT
jgi:hypothetical protein